MGKTSLGYFLGCVIISGQPYPVAEKAYSDYIESA